MFGNQSEHSSQQKSDDYLDSARLEELKDCVVQTAVMLVAQRIEKAKEEIALTWEQTTLLSMTKYLWQLNAGNVD